MRGLAFPTAAVSPRESSYDYGTPFSGGGNENAIDPALRVDTPIDPALLGGDGYSSGVPVTALPPHTVHQPAPIPIRQYSQGPQGDPFAPLPPYVPVEQPSMPVQKPPKKKRKVVREMECGFCQGDDNKNNNGFPEPLLTCSECGRSGHPSCLQLEELGGTLRSYPWKCAECKSCEVCNEKSGDSNMLICDACDRGWHMGCLQPPLTEEPPGKWYCPICPPPLDTQERFAPEHESNEQYLEPSEPIDPEILAADMTTSPRHRRHRESSIASSSQSIAPYSSKSRRKGKSKASVTSLVTDESEVDVDGDVDGINNEQTPTAALRRRSKVKSRWKGKQPAKNGTVREQDEETGAETQTDLETTQLRPIKRMRLRLSSPIPPNAELPSSPHPPLRLKLLPPKGKGKEREHESADDGDDGGKKGMFDDLLTPEDRDTTQTTITQADKTRFERARTTSEHKFNPPPPPVTLPSASESPETPVAGPSTRRSTLLHLPIPPPTPGPATLSPAPSTPAPDAATPVDGVPRIRSIRFGEYEIQTWYNAPFPEEYYTSIVDGRLWICEFCLKYMKNRFVATRHQLKCKMRHPPGDEIYRDGYISIFEVDGRKNKIYCQNLCLLSKMFLDHKSLFYDVEPFLFYVMTEVDDMGARFVGYFSKEKRSPKDYNVSCIMTLPVRQRQGWGNLLIDFSYLLSKKEQRAGSPEKPLSALGALGYRNYWTLALMRYLRTTPKNPKLEDISKATSMTIEDIYNTLIQQNMITVLDAAPSPKPLPGQTIKFPKGRKNGIARKHLQRTTTNDDEKVNRPFIPPRSYRIHWEEDYVEEYMAKWEAKGYLRLKPENLKWSPFLIARTPKSAGVSTKAKDESMVQAADAADDDLCQADEVDTPGAGPSSSKSHVRATDTPFALFDDPIEAPEARNSRHNSPDPDDPSQPQREGPNTRVSPRKRNHPDVIPTRRSRRSSNVPVIATPSPKKSHSFPSKRQPPPPSLRRRRSSVKVPPVDEELTSLTPEDHLAQDAALAAKLAREEGRPRRQLRSHSNHESDLTSLVSTTPKPRAQQSRKRKRDEMESSPEPEPSLSPVTPRQIHTRRSSLAVIGKGNHTPKTPVNSRKPPAKRLPPSVPLSRRNSRTTRAARRVRSPSHASESEERISLRREEEEEEEEEKEEHPAPLRESPKPMEGEEEEPEEAPPGQPSRELSGHASHASSLHERHEEEEEEPGEDVKFEALDTPLTGITSRHSAPSDDTMCVPEEHRDATKGTPGPLAATPFRVNGHAAPPHGPIGATANGMAVRLEEEEEEEEEEAVAPSELPKTTSKPPASIIPTQVQAQLDVEVDLDADIDAEGEPDIDAEGEDDIDAEGEPDEDAEYEVF
ncbi:unnamed protein product [Somion occarium]|uniref:Histone acetyltransferase n=1 Tax=Somion occarium TaxID=3059160 RepID=A0ABP1EBA1_9APHY